LALLSFRRKPETSIFKRFWTPAYAGVTVEEHCETISFAGMTTRAKPYGIGLKKELKAD